MGAKQLNCLATLNNEADLLSNLNCVDLIDAFAKKKLYNKFKFT